MPVECEVSGARTTGLANFSAQKSGRLTMRNLLDLAISAPQCLMECCFLSFFRFRLFASWLFGFLLVSAAFGGFLAFPVPLWQVAFWLLRGFSRAYAAAFAFRVLCFPCGCFGFCALSLVFGFGSPHHQHHQLSPYFNHHFFESWGGSPPPTCYFLDSLQSNCTPI